MPEVEKAIYDALDTLLSIERVDLYEVATILQPLFANHSLIELAQSVAYVAVLDGCRYLIWEPPENPLPPITVQRSMHSGS